MSIDNTSEHNSVTGQATEDGVGSDTAPNADELLLGKESEQDPTLSVVVPTLNEEEGIATCIEWIKTAIEEMGVLTEIVISDSSTDRTPEIAREMGAIVVTPEEGGYGNAYKFGFANARGEYIAIGDADTTYDFKELPRLVRVANEEDADMVMGSRLDGEIKPGAMPTLHQYVGNPLLTKFLNVFYDADVSDAHSGFRVISRDALEELDLQSEGMEFASEMIMDAAAKDMTIAETPITYHEREGEATLDTFRDGWRHVKFMLMNAPGYLFSLPATMFMVVGVLMMAVSTQGAELFGATFGLQTMIGGAVFAIVGYQVGSLALFSSIATDPIRDPQDPLTRLIRESFKLEHGASLGLLLFGAGAAYLAYSVVQWSVTGYTVVPPAVWTLVAATAVVIGTQTVFSSFFMSLLAESRG